MKSNFVRKLVYMGVALGLFVVILLVRAPIDRIRTENSLADATLGDVDPTSSTMVLVLGGLRGVASNLLWSQALEMQREQDWTNLEVVVKSIVKLEPHFISIWTFQGWNLAYNVSVEWDQVEDKYYWIKQGIKFLQSGTQLNDRSAELKWDTGWTYFHKLGKADEATLLRKIFQNDDKPEIDAQGREQPPFNPEHYDNYRASLNWFKGAVATLDRPPATRPKRMGEVAFRSYPAHSQTNSVQGKEDDGNFGEQIQAEWLDALQLWRDYADHEFMYADGKKTKLDYPPEIFADMYRSVTLMTRIESLDKYLTAAWDKLGASELVEQVKLVEPGRSAADLEGLSAEDLGKLKSQWASVLWEMIRRDTPQLIAEFGQPTIDILPPGASEALAATRSGFDGAASVDPALLTETGAEGDKNRKLVHDLATPAIQLGRFCHEELYWCDRYASMINFRYWKERTAGESELDTIAARRHFYTGSEKFKTGNLETAKDEFEKGIELWKKVLAKFERVRDDDLTAEETMKIVKMYRSVRQQLDLPEMTEEEIPFADYFRKYAPPQVSAEASPLMMQPVEGARAKGDEEFAKQKKAILEKLGKGLKQAEEK